MVASHPWLNQGTLDVDCTIFYFHKFRQIVSFLFDNKIEIWSLSLEFLVIWFEWKKHLSIISLFVEEHEWWEGFEFGFRILFVLSCYKDFIVMTFSIFDLRQFDSLMICVVFQSNLSIEIWNKGWSSILFDLGFEEHFCKLVIVCASSHNSTKVCVFVLLVICTKIPGVRPTIEVTNLFCCKCTIFEHPHIVFWHTLYNSPHIKVSGFYLMLYLADIVWRCSDIDIWNCAICSTWFRIFVWALQWEVTYKTLWWKIPCHVVTDWFQNLISPLLIAYLTLIVILLEEWNICIFMDLVYIYLFIVEACWWV